MRAAPRLFDLVNFDQGVELTGAFQNFAHLIRGDGVQTAAEGVELDQLQVVARAHEFGRPVQAEWYTHWSFTRRGMLRRKRIGNAVLGEHRQVCRRRSAPGCRG